MSESTKLQTKIIEGIKVTINPEVLLDWDVVMALVDVLEDPDGGDEISIAQAAKKIRAIESVTERIFGYEQFERIKEEIRAKHDGLLPIEPMMQFIGSIYDAFTAKN